MSLGRHEFNSMLSYEYGSKNISRSMNAPLKEFHPVVLQSIAVEEKKDQAAGHSCQLLLCVVMKI